MPDMPEHLLQLMGLLKSRRRSSTSCVLHQTCVPAHASGVISNVRSRTSSCSGRLALSASPNQQASKVGTGALVLLILHDRVFVNHYSGLHSMPDFLPISRSASCNCETLHLCKLAPKQA
ncbi:TPA: hypothetical protein ACH3X2_005325 [Trebouxia sp. C0005]